MNSDDALEVLAKSYCIPAAVILAEISKIRGKDGGNAISNQGLADWLREEAMKYERGFFYPPGQRAGIDTLSRIALFRLCADRLEQPMKTFCGCEPIAVA